jgi:hypothetical protein
LYLIGLFFQYFIDFIGEVAVELLVVLGSIIDFPHEELANDC